MKIYQDGIVGDVLMARGTSTNGSTESPEYEQLVNYTMLYDEGDECIDVTGGWNEYTKTSNPQLAIFRTNNALKLDDYSKIACLGYGTGTYNRISLFYSTTTTPSSLSDRINMYLFETDIKELRITDVALSGDYYIFIGSTCETVYTFTPTTIKNADYLYCKTSISTGTEYDSYIYGTFLFKSDDISTLAKKAGLSAPADLATLLADTTSLATIFNNEDAVNFMVKQCTGDFMVSVIADNTALELLQKSLYYTTVQANEHWTKFLSIVA